MSAVAKPRWRMRAGDANSYAAASSFLQLATWITAGGDADEAEHERDTLVARSWDLFRNNPLATSAVETLVDNVVGTGLRMQSRLDAARLGITQAEADAWEADVEERFAQWAERAEECDLEAKLTFVDHQRVALTTGLCSGDSLVSMPMVARPWSVNRTRLQAIDPARLSNPQFGENTVRMTGGIERDRFGAPLRYHVLEAHPESSKIDSHIWRWNALPAHGRMTGRRNVLHTYRTMRPGQSRGVPFLAPVAAKLKQLDRYTEAEIIAAVVSGMFSVFVKTEDGDGLAHGEDSAIESEAAANGMPQNGSAQAMGYGSIIDLQPNESIESASPGRPNQNFDGFFMSMARVVGAGVGIPVEILLKHFTRSYSASRGARLEANRMFAARRSWFSRSFCQPVYETWLMEQISEGRVKAPGFFSDPERRALWSRAEWIGPSPGQLDPVKETQAEFMAFELTATPLADITQRLYGQDHTTVVRRIARERRLLETEGVPIPTRGNQEDADAALEDPDAADGPPGAAGAD